MKQKNNRFYIYLLTLLATIITSCDGLGRRTDEEKMKSLELQKKEFEEVAKKHQHNMADQKSCKASLEKNNEELEKEIQGKKQEEKEVLQEIYDDSKLNESFPANCTVCGKTVSITYGKFYEMVSRYNTTSTRHESCKEEPVYEYKDQLTTAGALLMERSLWSATY
jgi:hypothetical protein